MARYQVTLAYDGTDFQGFQRQAEGRRAVQGVVEDALGQIGWSGRSILAAGRTDAGVHASGQVIAFDLDWQHSVDDLRNALNAHLPADVAARRVRTAAPGFHPRYDASSRRYRYRILCDPVRDPLRERYAWRVWPAPDGDALRQAAAPLVGEWDFGAFGRAHQPGGSTIRRVHQALWEASEGGFSFWIEANAFLYHMVRRVVFLQIQVGQGLVDPAALEEQLRGGPVSQVHGLAPPQGLYLVEVKYPVEAGPMSRTGTSRLE